jgi:hypothetical protein
VNSSRTTNRGRRLTWPMIGRFRRRPKRATCGSCSASHPAIYEGASCLICGSTIKAANEHRKSTGALASKQRKTKEAESEYEAEIAALRSERDELRDELKALEIRQGSVGTPDYEWHVELAAKGLAQRDHFPMPPSVTEQEEFYEIMAGAALDATGLRSLLERMAQAERSLETILDALRHADIRVQNARHLSTTEAADDPFVTIAGVAPAGRTAPSRASEPRPTTTKTQDPKATMTKQGRGLPGLYSMLSRGWLDRRPGVRRQAQPKRRNAIRP